jgi:hypothetical protein
VLLHVADHLLVDALGGAPQREFTQGREVARREVVLECPLGLIGDVDLTLAQPLHQIVWGQIDDLDFRRIDDAVGHGLAHAHARDLGNDVVQTLEMLDVDGGVDVDAGRE